MPGPHNFALAVLAVVAPRTLAHGTIGIVHGTSPLHQFVVPFSEKAHSLPPPARWLTLLLVLLPLLAYDDVVVWCQARVNRGRW